MSKFCGVISNKANNSDLQPLQFENLEVITEWLLNETAELYGEFKIKCEAVQEQHQQMRLNEQNLEGINDLIENFKKRVLVLELEVKNNDTILQQLERRTLALNNDATCLNIDSCRTQYQYMVQLLLSTDQAMLKLNDLLEQISEYEKYLRLQTSPYNIIFGILDRQLETLEISERNLDRIIQKTSIIELDFLQLKEKIGKSGQISQPTNMSTQECDEQ